MKKIKNILCILISLVFLIPQSAIATTAATNKEPKVKLSRQLKPDELYSIKDGTFNCFYFRNYGLEMGVTDNHTTLAVAGFTFSLIEVFKGFGWVTAIKLTAVLFAFECMLSYKDYQDLRRSIGRANLENMTKEELSDFIIRIGEKRAELKLLSKQSRNRGRQGYGAR